MLLIIDSNNLVFKAFFAVKPEEMTYKDKPIGTVYGVTNMLMSYLKKFKPQYVVACFDSQEAPLKRKEIYPEYKSTRKEKPDALREQMPLIEKMFEVWGIPVAKVPGWEADDLIATIASGAQEAGIKVNVISGDKDLLQILSPNVTVTEPITGASNFRIWTEEEFLANEKYGFSPALLPDFKALMGDKSDNIPGLTHVGKEKAKKLITTYGGLESIFDALSAGKIEPSLLAETLKNERDQAFCFRSLATVCKTVPFGVNITPFEPDVITVQKFFIRWKFARLLDRAENLISELRSETE